MFLQHHIVPTNHYEKSPRIPILQKPLDSDRTFNSIQPSLYARYAYLKSSLSHFLPNYTSILFLSRFRKRLQQQVDRNKKGKKTKGRQRETSLTSERERGCPVGRVEMGSQAAASSFRPCAPPLYNASLSLYVCSPRIYIHYVPSGIIDLIPLPARLSCVFVRGERCTRASELLYYKERGIRSIGGVRVECMCMWRDGRTRRE